MYSDSTFRLDPLYQARTSDRHETILVLAPCNFEVVSETRNPNDLLVSSSYPRFSSEIHHFDLDLVDDNVFSMGNCCF